MAKQTINIGSTANDGTGDPLRTAFNKANENFTEVYDIAQGAYDYANTIVSDTQVDPLARSIANSAFDAANAIATFDQDLNTTNSVSFSSVSTDTVTIGVGGNVNGQGSTLGNFSTISGSVFEIDQGVQEKFSAKSGATGTVTHDCSDGQIFYHTSPSANFTANFTNLTLASGRATSLTLVIDQGGTGYIANNIQIGGSAQTINWSGNTEPTANTNSVDVMSFSVLNNSGTFVVLGQLSTFG